MTSYNKLGCLTIGQAVLGKSCVARQARDASRLASVDQNLKSGARRDMRRLVFISLEFSAGTFSGNGVYASSQAGLSSCLHTHPASSFRNPILHTLQRTMASGSKFVPAAMQLAGHKRQAKRLHCSRADRRCSSADTGQRFTLRCMLLGLEPVVCNLHELQGLSWLARAI